MTGTSAPPNDPLIAAGIPLTITRVADAAALTQYIEAHVPPDQRASPSGPTGALYIHMLAVGSYEDAARRRNEPTRAMWEEQIFHGYPFALAAMRALLSEAAPSITAPSTHSVAATAKRRPSRRRGSVPRARSARSQPPPTPWARLPAMETDYGPLGFQVPRIPETITDGMVAVQLGAVIQALIPELDWTPAMREIVAGTVALARMHTHPGDPGERERVDRHVVTVYETVYRETRAYLTTTERRSAAEDDQKRTRKAALEQFIALYAERDELRQAQPARSPRPAVVASAAKRSRDLRRGQPLMSGAVLLIPTRDVDVDPERRRRADLDHVAALAQSIGASGLSQPIVVTPDGELVAGLHRLLAHEKLGLSDVAAYVRDVEGQQKRLAEIDENLIRRQLPALELAELTGERQQIYEALHPEARQHHLGGHRKASKAASDIVSPAESFAASMAAKTKLTKRSIQRYTQIAGISPSARDVLRDTTFADKTVELIALARVPTADQPAVAKALRDGTVKRVAQAYAALQVARMPAPPPYAITQAPVIRRQQGALRRLRDDLQSTTPQWRQHSAVGMKSFIDYNDQLVRTLAKALDAAPAEIPAEACPCGGVARCKKCDGRGWLPGEKKTTNGNNYKK